jgi:spermidine synthase
MSHRTACGIVLVGLGWASLQTQVGLLRELLVAASGSELALFLGLAFWMTGTAVGALLYRPSPIGSRLPEMTSIRLGLASFALLAPLAAVLLRFLRVLAAEPAGALLPLGLMTLGAVAALALPGLLSGWLFARTASLAAAEGLPLGTAYGIESLGGLVGGLLATVLPAVWFGNLSVILAGGAIAGLAAVGAADKGLCARWLPVPLLLLGALPFSHRIDVRLSRAYLPFLLEVRDTPYGRVAVTSHLGQFAVFADGALAFESQGTSVEESAHAAALMVEHPDRILLLGGVAEGFLPEFLKHHPAQIDCVELDRHGLEISLQAAPPGVRGALCSPLVRLMHEDPRRFLAASNTPYDLIFSALSDPRTSASSRMWTREAFEACRTCLCPGGVLAMRLHAPENLWTALDIQRGASLLRTFREVFPYVLILPGGETLLLASGSPLSRDPALPLARWRSRAIDAQVVSEASLTWRLRDPRGPELEAKLAGATAPSNTDTHSICHPLTLALWLSRFAPRTASRPLLPTWGTVVWAGAAVSLLVGVGLLRARTTEKGRALALAALSGAGGMLLQASLLLAFQAWHGVLYQDLGLLLTLFMGGMAAGASLLKLPPRTLLIALMLTSIVSFFAVSHPSRLSWPFAGLFLFLSGAGGGALFGAAGRIDPSGSGHLYAADLAGGCLSALLAALVLPLIGIQAGPILLLLLALGALATGMGKTLPG